MFVQQNIMQNIWTYIDVRQQLPVRENQEFLVVIEVSESFSEFLEVQAINYLFHAWLS